MAKYVHSMIRVLDEARSVEFYDRCFGLKVAERLDFPDFTLVYLANGESETELELTVNKGRTEPYALGDGYGHMVDFAPGGEVIARFFFIADPDGYQIEVIQRGGRYK